MKRNEFLALLAAPLLLPIREILNIEKPKPEFKWRQAWDNRIKDLNEIEHGQVFTVVDYYDKKGTMITAVKRNGHITILNEKKLPYSGELPFNEIKIMGSAHEGKQK